MGKKKRIPLDTRILKTEYKNYDLIARFWNGAYRGRVWKNKQVIADYEGENLDLILEALVNIVDQDRKQKHDEFQQLTDSERWRQIWLALKPKFSEQFNLAVAKLCQAKEFSVTAGALSSYANYDSIGLLIEELTLFNQKFESESMQDLTASPSITPITINPPDTGNKKSDQTLAISQMAATEYLLLPD